MVTVSVVMETSKFSGFTPATVDWITIASPRSNISTVNSPSSSNSFSSSTIVGSISSLSTLSWVGLGFADIWDEPVRRGCARLGAGEDTTFLSATATGPPDSSATISAAMACGLEPVSFSKKVFNVLFAYAAFVYCNFRHDSSRPARNSLRVGREISLRENRAFASSHCLKLQYMKPQSLTLGFSQCSTCGAKILSAGIRFGRFIYYSCSFQTFKVHEYHN